MYVSLRFELLSFSQFFCFIQDYKEKPDYARCVAIVAAASLKEMIKPGALAIISPIAVGGLTSVFNCACLHIYYHSLVKLGGKWKQ